MSLSSSSSTAALVPLKSKRVPISFVVWSTALRISTRLGSRTASKLGMAGVGWVQRLWVENSAMPSTPLPNSQCPRVRALSLRDHNTFGLPATARRLVRIRERCRRAPRARLTRGRARAPKLVLGGGSNLVLTRDIDEVVLKVEVRGLRLVGDARRRLDRRGRRRRDLARGRRPRRWTSGWPGLENLALIPGTVGAAPVQNIGAYGVELADRFDSLDGVDLVTGRGVTLDRAQCLFGYRDSVFKHVAGGKAIITRVRFRLPRPWQPVLGYLELERKVAETGIAEPDAAPGVRLGLRDPARQAARPGA